MTTERIVLACYALSGLACLTYEILWNMLFRSVTGSPESANALALGVSMAGLALGNFVGGRVANGTVRPLILYGRAEVMTGLLAFGIAATVYSGVSGNTFGRWGLLAVSMLPFVLSGCGPPLLTRFFVSRVSEVGPRLGSLVFIQTLGALAACVVAGTRFLQNLEPALAMLLTGTVNVLAGAIVLGVRRWAPALPELTSATSRAESFRLRPKVYSEGQKRSVLLLVFAAGSLTMSYELTWAAMLRQVSSDHLGAFPAMLFMVIGGLGLGGLVSTRLMRNDQINALLAFGVGQIGLVAAVLGVPIVALGLFGFDLRQLGTLPMVGTGESLFGAAAILCLIPSVFVGMSSPLASRVYAPDADRVAGSVGAVLATATAGNLVGAVLVGFVVLPSQGVSATLACTLVSSLAIGIAAVAVATSPGKLLENVPGGGR